jgi:hypothetical protein
MGKQEQADSQEGYNLQHMQLLENLLSTDSIVPRDFESEPEYFSCLNSKKTGKIISNLS